MLSLINVQFYQHMHDAKYHHDIFVLTKMRKVSHLTHHLIKYNNGIRGEHYYADSLACILSMANAFNIHLSKELRKMEMVVNTIEEAKPYYSNERIDTLIGNNLKALSKAIEAFDHIEEFDYHGQISKCVCNLFILIHQSFAKNHPDLHAGNSANLFIRWFERLSMIKQKHVFYEFFHEEDLKVWAYNRVNNLLDGLFICSVDTLSQSA